jgi:aldehyde:ferredoxin oxidoreductase
VYRRYYGGCGLAARLYMDLPALPAPTEPAAPLYIIPGLVTGTLASSACRIVFCGRSPLTGIWNEATAGGFFGAELRFAGWDGIILTGRAARPSLLWIEDDKAALLPAESLWGLETLEAAEQVRALTDRRAQTAVIGPAGERLLPMANVMLGGDDCRAAGRGGMGAVMGSKSLKAIAVRGHGRPVYAHDADFKALVRESNAKMKEAYVGLGKLGTGGGLLNAAKAGDLPVKNWVGGAWMEGAQKITGATMAERGLIAKNFHCHACPVGCTQHLHVPSGPYAGREGHAPEYETLAGFGANCLNDDLDAIITANERCNRLGLDTISASGAIAFALEAGERGMIGPELAGGRELRWGDAATIVALVDEIGAGQGFGAFLGRGVRAMANDLGPAAVAFAPHAKGMEMPYHDPRAEISMAANYASGNRGACHLSSLSYSAMWGFSIPGVYQPDPFDRHKNEGKGRMAAEWQNFMSAVNALGTCKLVCKTIIDPPLAARWLQLAVGWEDATPAEVLQTGERIFNLERLINARFGISAQDDILADRFVKDAHPDGSSAGVLPDMTLIMRDYYATRGWDARGQPTTEKLRQLSLA